MTDLVVTRNLVFEDEGDFCALEAARKWCRDHGYSYGSLQADAPTGLLKGLYEISKWRNMTPAEREALDGTMDAPGRTYRTGPVTIRVKELLSP